MVNKPHNKEIVEEEIEKAAFKLGLATDTFKRIAAKDFIQKLKLNENERDENAEKIGGNLVQNGRGS